MSSVAPVNFTLILLPAVRLLFQAEFRENHPKDQEDSLEI